MGDDDTINTGGGTAAEPAGTTTTAEPEQAPQPAPLQQEPEPQVPAVPRPPLQAGSPIQAMIPRDLNETFRLADAVHQSGLAPYGLKSPQAVMVAIMHGLEIGLPPMQALQSIAVINGKPSIYGDAGLALIERSGLLEDFSEEYIGTPFEDGFTARCTMKRKGRDRVVTNEYSVADARKANYWEGRHIEEGKRAKTPWVTNPRRMLRWRARWFTMRDLFSDVLRGLASAEEMNDVEPIDVTPNAPAATKVKPAQDIGAKLAAGTKPEVVYTSGRAAAAVQQDADATQIDGNAPQTADLDLAANGASETAEATAPMDGAAGDMFEQGAIMELRTALADPDLTLVALKVIRDEFQGAMDVASPTAKATMLDEFIKAEAALS